MQKKNEVKKVEVKVEPLKVEQPKKFPKEDKLRMIKLWRTAGLSSQDVQDLLTLYRKYVNPNQPSNNLGSCGNCAGSIKKLYEGLRDWYNPELFED